ncbi:hypothetical protein N1851_024562 [Merluccius polli]|uniref:DUF4371 domain-containing protein n=1 Tax=Merluccius polli TaxID=89951 RepID=A0AA47MF19_MERPO|nr:hypothetical protein N1851_024562 [Merluccius polli]
MRRNTENEVSTLVNTAQLRRNRYYVGSLIDVVGVLEHLLCIATAQKGDAQTLTDTVLTELNNVGLDCSKILSQVYDGASVMSGKRGGVQKILQERLGHEIPYVHCLNQLHFVVVHAMSAETAILDSLYKFCRKPTVAMHYKGVHLKRLLEQRWTGHLATVSVILKSFDDIKSILTDADTVLDYGAETRMEATGLLRKVSEPSFMFLANLTHRVLALLDPPNKLLQREDTDLLMCSCVKKLCCDEEFRKVLDAVTATSESLRHGPKRRCIERTQIDGYIVMGPTGAHRDRGDDDLKTELRRLYYDTIDSVVREIERRFSERNSQLASALAALNPEADNFLM